MPRLASTHRAARTLAACLTALAVACGAANTQRFGAGVFDPADVEALMRRVEVVLDED